MRKYYLIFSHTRTQSYFMFLIGKETAAQGSCVLVVQNHTGGKWKNWNLGSGLKLGFFRLLRGILSSLLSPALLLVESDSGVSSVCLLALSFLSSPANGRLWQFTDWGREGAGSKVRKLISQRCSAHFPFTSSSIDFPSLALLSSGW